MVASKRGELVPVLHIFRHRLELDVLLSRDFPHLFSCDAACIRPVVIVDLLGFSAAPDLRLLALLVAGVVNVVNVDVVLLVILLEHIFSFIWLVSVIILIVI